MEVEKFFKCDHCGVSNIHAKVWIKWKIFFLCKDCHDKEEKLDEK